LQREGQQPSNYAWQARVLPETRTIPYWDEVEIAWDAAGETLRNLLRELTEIYKAAAELYAEGHDHLEDVMGNISNLLRRLTEADANITGMISKPIQGMVYWIEVQPHQNRLSLNAAPLSVAALVEKYLWHEKRSVILTSATLTTHGEFGYIRSTLGADEADEMQLGSPYDYENAALLYIANDMPEPNQNGYEQMLNRTIISTAKATGGRMLVLFTSYAALKRASRGITSALARDEIYVYEQGDGASPNALLESFKATDRAVLLGTKSFWEGIDGDHGHCAIPASQVPVFAAFVDKFLLGVEGTDTNVRTHPYGGGLDPERWSAWWGTNSPVFSSDWDAGDGKLVQYISRPLTVPDSSTVRAGFSVALPFEHPEAVVTMVGGSVQLDVLSLDGRSYTLTVPFENNLAYVIPENFTGWIPSEFQNVPLAFRGSATAGIGGSVTNMVFSAVGANLTGGAGNAAGPGLFTSAGDRINVRFHVDTGTGEASGSWSPTATVASVD
jgi:hypothetical protein